MFIFSDMNMPSRRSGPHNPAMNGQSSNDSNSNAANADPAAKEASGGGGGGGSGGNGQQPQGAPNAAGNAGGGGGGRGMGPRSAEMGHILGENLAESVLGAQNAANKINELEKAMVNLNMVVRQNLSLRQLS